NEDDDNQEGKVRERNQIEIYQEGIDALTTPSIHKPPASIRFAPIKHALAVTVESFKVSSR
ncbi:MAG: hypothetical protein KJP23_10835, partial [Deltaproteobacteria bacterium]|nr:hypothetical protein [Deltaproteobacteria bacterium]